MQKQPNEYWLKYMVAVSGLANTAICSSARLQGLIPPETEYLVHLREIMSVNRPRTLRITDGRAVAWLRGHKILSMTRNDKAVVEARAILGEPTARSVIEPLILSGMPDADVALYTTKLGGVSVSKEAAAAYRHYFWNPAILPMEAWYSYVSGMPNHGLLRECYKRSPEFVLWKLGYRVELAQDDVLKAVFHESSMRFFETGSMRNDRSTAMTARLWAENLFKASEMLNSSGDGVREILSDLRQLSIQLGRRDISDLDSLKTGKASKAPRKKDTPDD